MIHINRSLLPRQSGQLKRVNGRIEDVNRAVGDIRRELAEQDVAISTTIRLNDGLYVTGGGDEPGDAYILGFTSSDYTNARNGLATLFNNYTGNSFENVDIDLGLSKDSIRYDIRVNNRIGYFTSGDDGNWDNVDGVDTFASAKYISIDAIPIQPNMRGAANNNGTVVSFALEKDDDGWKAPEDHPMLRKAAQMNGKYYDCFITSIADPDSWSHPSSDIVGWIPDSLSASPIEITYTINGLNL